MNKKVIQLDSYDEVELWAGGLLQMRLRYNNGKLIQMVSGPMSLGTEAQKPQVITELKKEGLLDEQHS